MSCLFPACTLPRCSEHEQRISKQPAPAVAGTASTSPDSCLSALCKVCSLFVKLCRHGDATVRCGGGDSGVICTFPDGVLVLLHVMAFITK